MTSYPAGPYQVEYHLLTTINSQPLVHSIKVNCQALANPVPGTAITGITLATRSGGNVNASTGIQNFWNMLRGGLSSTSTTLTGVTLWKMTGVGDGKLFISAANPSPATGSVASAAQPGHQTTLTFRSGIGGVAKVVLVEDIETGKGQVVLTANSSGSWIQRVAAYVMSAEGWIAGRGNSWPIAPMKASYTFNEAVEEQRHR